MLLSMPQVHVIPAPTRRAMLELLRSALAPDASIDVVRSCVRDLYDMVQADDFRAGYVQRFWARVAHDGGHMVWTGAGQDTPDGRPVCEYRGKRIYAAKVAWLILRLELIPDDVALRKTCDTPRCIAPDCHIKQPRATAFGRPSSLRLDADGRPVCKNGHPLLREPKPRETVYCPTCAREDRRILREAKAAQWQVERYARTPRATAPQAITNPLHPGYKDPNAAPEHALTAVQRESTIAYFDWFEQVLIASGDVQDPNTREVDHVPATDPRVQAARAWLRDHLQPPECFDPQITPLVPGDPRYWWPKEPNTVLSTSSESPGDDPEAHQPGTVEWLFAP